MVIAMPPIPGNPSLGAGRHLPGGPPAVLLLVAVLACAAPVPRSAADDAASAPMPCADLPTGAAHEIAGALDPRASPTTRRVVLMGGSSEVGAAARAFVEAAAGGDVLTLRSSGRTGSYNGYFHGSLGAEPAPRSAATIRLDEASAGSHAAVLCRVGAAEGIWLAGGNQWNYLGDWPTELHDVLAAASGRGVPIGGTSAGAMALGEAAFDAREGGVGSDSALANPLASDVSVSASPLAQPELAGWLVDSHFHQRNREGRLLAFLARARQVLGRDTVFGLGLDERAAVVIEDGRFTVHAAEGRGAWFYRVAGPAVLEAGRPLGLGGIERFRLEDGASGAWPPPFDAQVDTFRVVEGVIVR
jgi:cyanophycinase-like exopeptidase